MRNVTPMPISSDFREFIELLRLENVEYLVVGAYAVAWQGHPRYTGDLLVRPRRKMPCALGTFFARSALGVSAWWNTRLGGAIGGAEVPMIGLAELLRNKESTGRAKDRADADELRKRSAE
jgi:hypothetical protein